MVMRRGWRGRGRRREYRWFRLRSRGPELRRDLPRTEGFPEAVGRAGIEGSEEMTRGPAKAGLKTVLRFKVRALPTTVTLEP